MFCTNCGKEIPNGSEFCPNCGAKIGGAPVQPGTPKAPSSGNGKLIAVIIAIAAVFLIVAIIFGILILGKLGDKDDSDKDNDKNAQTETTIDENEDFDDFVIETDDSATADADIEEAETSDETLADDLEAYIAERFPRLTETYQTPKTDKSLWIPIDDETRAKLDALDSDYNKVAWVVEYAFRSVPSVIVSYTINENCGVPYVFVAFTNIGDRPITINGTVDIFDFDNNKIASGYPYTGMLQSGGTYICPIACLGADENNIDIGYSDFTMDLAAATPGSFVASYSVGDSTPGSIISSISVENTCEKKVNMGQVTILLLDEMGFPVANGYVFGALSIDPGAALETDASIGILDEDVEKVKDEAIFCSPFVVG